MSGSFIILLLVGIVMMMAGAVQKRDSAKAAVNRAVLAGADTVDEDPSVRVVYKYLERDIDTFYREGDHNVPSTMYATIFEENSLDYLR